MSSPAVTTAAAESTDADNPPAPSTSEPQSELQSLLRLLATTAKIPLPTALKLAAPLHAAGLTPAALATAKLAAVLAAITPVLPADADAPKTARSIASAAKRAAKATTVTTTGKRKRPAAPSASTPAPALPTPIKDESRLQATKLTTNRAPLLLAFAAATLAHTMPAQPGDSRLSLAAGAVGGGAAARARELGVRPALTGEEGRAHAAATAGLRCVKVLGSLVPVLRRADVELEGEGGQGEGGGEAAYWAVDADASAKPSVTGRRGGTTTATHTPHAAHAYLTRTFDTPAHPEGLALLLGALELLVSSWAGVLDAQALDARAWSWYVAVRPAVAEGKAGWGGKGEVALEKMLSLRRQT